jgi:hypothetical protein
MRRRISPRVSLEASDLLSCWERGIPVGAGRGASRRRWFCCCICDSICNRSVSRSRAAASRLCAASSSRCNISIRRSAACVSAATGGVTGLDVAGGNMDVTGVSSGSVSGCNTKPARRSSAVSIVPSDARLNRPALMCRCNVTCDTPATRAASLMLSLAMGDAPRETTTVIPLGALYRRRQEAQPLRAPWHVQPHSALGKKRGETTTLGRGAGALYGHTGQNNTRKIMQGTVDITH